MRTFLRRCAFPLNTDFWPRVPRSCEILRYKTRHDRHPHIDSHDSMPAIPDSSMSLAQIAAQFPQNNFKNLPTTLNLPYKPRRDSITSNSPQSATSGPVHHFLDRLRELSIRSTAGDHLLGGDFSPMQRWEAEVMKQQAWNNVAAIRFGGSC